MPVVEVSCPGCGAKLKAPDNMAGKKARCKKCGQALRLPGPPPASESAGDGVALSAISMPVPALPGDEAAEVMMAEPVVGDEADPPKDLSSLPSADPFDFGKPAAKPAPVPAQPARPAFGAAKPAGPLPPAAKPAPAPKPAAPAPKPAAPAPAAAVTKPTPAPLAPTKPAAKSAPAPRSRDDEDSQSTKDLPPAEPKAKSKPKLKPPEESRPAADNPFAFDAPAEGEKSRRRDDEEDEDDDRTARSKRRGDDEDDEDDRPRKKRRDEEDDEGDRPAKAKRRDEEDEEDEAPRKKRRKEEDEDGEDEKPAKSKAAEPFNPFAGFSNEPEEPRPKKRRDEEEDEDDRPTKSKRRDEDEQDERKPRKKRRDDEGDEDEKATPRYRRPDEKSGGNTTLITAIVGGLALVLGIAAVIVYVRANRKEPEVTKEEKKEETAPTTPPGTLPGVPGMPGIPPDPVQPKADPKAKDPDPKAKDKNPDPKLKDKNPDPKPKDNVPDPGPTRPTVTLGRLKGFNVGTLPAKTEAADRPRAGMILDVPLASVRRVFPPSDPKTGDTFVLVQAGAALTGKGEKFALHSYGPAGNRVPGASIEYEGDGLASPIADLHATADGAFFLAAIGGRLHVWSVGGKMKVADGVSPYAEKPEHAKAGLAAAFFSPDPKLVVTVSTAGAVLLFDYAAGKAVSEFVPPDGAPGKVALGQSAAVADGHGSVAVAVAGVVYQLKAAPGLEVMRKYDLGGDVGRSIALSVSGTPGRLLYAFETAPDKTGKKEKAVMGLPLKATKHIIHPLPAAAGEPKGALWANGTVGGVATDRGVVWFDDEEERFVPLFVTQPPAPGLYFGSDQYFWYVVAHPKDMTKSVLVALAVPFDGQTEYERNYTGNKPLQVVKIDGTGLSK